MLHRYPSFVRCFTDQNRLAAPNSKRLTLTSELIESVKINFKAVRGANVKGALDRHLA